VYTDQREFDIRCEWGLEGVARLAPICDAIVIVDVLSFSTSVDIAVAHGAVVYPCRWRDESAAAYARSRDAILAGPPQPSGAGYSLSPASLVGIPAETRLVLPSPNGSALSLATGGVPTFAACLRNARAVARAASSIGPRIGLVPAGERWPDGSLRPALEDLIGAGAVVRDLVGARSPEAEAAEASFLRFRDDLVGCLSRCSSGKESIGRGRLGDVELASALNASACAPVLRDGAYVQHRPGG
jgi:2-phosphosulfolactate phosphatase